MTRRIGLLASLALLALASVAQAADAPVDPDSRRTRAGFAGSIVVTPDEDWRAKWATPSDTVPKFTEADTVPRGSKVTVLIFFANPARDAAGNVDLACDVRFTQPTGKVGFEQKGLTCYRGKLSGGARSVYLALPALEFVGDPGDPLGTWRVDVTLHDRRSGADLPLFTAFTLRE